MKAIRFQGSEYVLISRRGHYRSGLIATREAYEALEESYAHLFEDGRILRHAKQIGTRDDIEWLDDVNEDAEPTP